MRYEDRTIAFLQTLVPGTGRLILEPNARPNQQELQIGNWVHQNLGGDVIFKARVEIEGVKNPDLEWRGGLVDIKHIIGGLNALDKRIQDAMHQTVRNGVFADISGSDFTDEQAIKTTINRLRRSGGRYVLLIRDNNLVAYIAAQ